MAANEPQWSRRLPVGAEPGPHGTAFRVWVPRCKSVDVVVEGRGPTPLAAAADGYFAGTLADVRPGDRYRLRLEGGDQRPDPASRFQPDGPHGPSEVIDPAAFAWTDDGWKGVASDRVVLYELHVGTFTPEGTWAAAAAKLPHLADVGVNCLEVMPVSEFAGTFGWGYDGVNWFAPTRLYGRPDDFRAFVNEAHRLGIGVILDVVYNHFGPDGNYLRDFAPHYFSSDYETDWGEAINYDGPDNAAVREYVCANATYWVTEFHLDGYRLDATQNIYDRSPEHIIAAFAKAARRAAPYKSLYVIAENEPQHSETVRSAEQGGQGLDALWNDDFHHTALVAMTGRNEAYYTDYRGTPQELISAARWGYLYQGQRYTWQKKRRGTLGLDLPPTAFVNFFENHDQVANSGRGLRAYQLTSPGRFRALTALLLLAPGTPMLFQGAEFASSKPFFYFADHNEGLAPLVANGRVEFLHQFPSLADPEMLSVFAVPHERATFERCKLDWSERERNAGTVAMHRDLLALRRDDATLGAGLRPEGAVLAAEAFCLRWFGPGGDRLLLINLGCDLPLVPAPEPLLAPVTRDGWRVLWSSEKPEYGGIGTAHPEHKKTGWRIPGHAALLLAPAEDD